MFPAGAAGCGLVLLRVCAAGMLVRNSTGHMAASIATWGIIGLMIIAGAFCLGAFTPVTCFVSMVVQVCILLRAHQPDFYQFAFSICITAALFLLGPGAFSIDSWIFGRRLIVHSN